MTLRPKEVGPLMNEEYVATFLEPESPESQTQLVETYFLMGDLASGIPVFLKVSIQGNMT